MKLYLSLPPAGKPPRPSVLAVGVFDGLHRGHLAVLKRTVAVAARLGLPAAALSFESMPEAVLGLPVPPRLGDPAENAAVAAALGLDRLYRVPFTRRLAAQSPQAFVERILLGRLACRAVVVGQGFRFGAGAKGDVQALHRFGARHGLTVHAVRPVILDQAPVSSTRLRQAVQAGRWDLARRLLGRPWRLRGIVERGRGLGAQLGFPTANLRSLQQALPPPGVWAGRVRVLGAQGPGPWWGFAANLGVRPTLGEGLAPTVELHLLGFRGNLRGRTLEAEFLRPLRPEQRFTGLPALQAQIKKDLARATAITRRALLKP